MDNLESSYCDILDMGIRDTVTDACINVFHGHVVTLIVR